MGGDKGNSMTFIRDPCGIVCLVITYGAVIYADYVVLRWIILQTMEARYVTPKQLSIMLIRKFYEYHTVFGHRYT